MKMRTARSTPLFASLLFVCACVPPSHVMRPQAPPALRYSTEPLALETRGAGTELPQRVALGERLDRAWWELFRSGALNDVVQRALEHNPTIAEAAHTLAQAEELALARAGTRSPQVGVTGGVGRQKLGVQLVGDVPQVPFTYFAVGPTVSYSLDYAGRNASAIEQQYALADFRRHQLQAAWLAVSGHAVTEALKIASARMQIAAVESLLGQDRENLRLVREAFAAGAVSRLDVVSAESQLAADTALAPPLRQELAVATHALTLLLGQAPAMQTLPEFDLTQIALPQRLPVSLPSELAHARPDILSAEAELHAAAAALGVARANLYPRIDLSAAFSFQSTTLGSLFGGGGNGWSVVGGVVAPLLDGGTLRAEQRAAADAVLASEARYRQVVLTAFSQVADALHALEHDGEALDALGHAERAARETLELTRTSYREGNTGVLQVLDAQRRYQQARLAQLRARAQRYLDTSQLFLALGGNGPAGPVSSPVSVSAAPPPASATSAGVPTAPPNR